MSWSRRCSVCEEPIPPAERNAMELCFECARERTFTAGQPTPRRAQVPRGPKMSPQARQAYVVPGARAFVWRGRVRRW